MVTYCCVPNCKSNSKVKAVEGSERISFHEFPGEKELKAAWLKNIPRENFDPNQRSTVCSRHFKEDCFRKTLSGQRRRLLPDAVPTEFCNLPDYLPVQVKIEVEELEYPTEETSLKRPEPDQDNGVEAHNSKKPRPEENEVQVNPLTYLNPYTGVPTLSSLEVQLEAANASQVDGLLEIVAENRGTIRKLQNKIHKLEGKNRLLENKIKNYEKDVNKVEQELKLNQEGDGDKLTIVRRLESESKEGNVGATFLLNLLSGYGKKNFDWADSVLRLCAVWRSRSPDGYKFPSESGLLTLPNSKTLSKYLSRDKSNSQNIDYDDIIDNVLVNLDDADNS